jgi:uncharacterized membrane protein YbhN (UPF0104 family)
MFWRWLFWLLLAAFLWFFIGRQIDFINLVSVFKHGLPIFLILAFCLQIANHSFRAILFQQAFYSLKVRSHFRDLFPAVFGALFMNVVVSFGGAGGFIFLVEDAKNRGHSAASATAGSLMIITTDFISIIIISIIGLVYLFTKNNLQTYEVAAAVILIALTVFLSSMMMLTFRWPKHLKSILLSFRNTANLVLKSLAEALRPLSSGLMSTGRSSLMQPLHQENIRTDP